MTRALYLVRHGHCEESGTLLGQTDVALTAAGIAQARRLAGELAGRDVERVLASDLRRAVETATHVAAALGVAVEVDARLREISYGEWDGRRWDEIERADPELARRKLDDWERWTPPGGEPFGEFVARVRRARESILASTARVTVVVAHRGVNAVLAGEPAGNFEQDYGTVRTLAIEAAGDAGRLGRSGGTTP